MNDLFQIITAVHPHIEGWCPIDKALTLAALIVAVRPEVSVETGVFGGRSFIPMALAHRAIGRGMAVGIDAWSKDVMMREYQGQPEHQEWWSKLDMDKVYSKFIQNINANGLSEWTRIIRNESKNVLPPQSIGVLHIDGGHSDTAVADAVRFGPKVSAGGFAIIDDTDGGHGPGPAKAEGILISTGFRRLYILGTGSVLQRQ